MPFHRPVGARVTENQIAPTFIRPLQDRRVVVGQSVMLECQVEANPAPVVKWLKDGQNVSQCPDYVIIQEGKFIRLLIENAQVSDCGRFTVQAMNAGGIKQSTCVLIVAPAPTPVPGMGPSVTSSPVPHSHTPVGGPSAPIFMKELRHQPLRISAVAIFEGRVVGLPPPTIQWFKDGKPIDQTFTRARIEYDPESGICTLSIGQMKPEDVGEYKCVAESEFGEASSTARIMDPGDYERWFVDEQHQITKERKQRLLDKQQKSQVQGGAQGVLQQRRPTPTQFAQQHGRLTPQRTTPQYILRQIAPENRGVPPTPPLSQQLVSPQSDAGSEDGILPPHQKSAGGAMAPAFRQGLRGLRLTEGTDAVLQCSVVGTPKPRIGWFKDGRPLDVSGRTSPRWQGQYSGSMAMLKISMVVPEDSGEYSLIAENLHGRAQSSARIEVYPLEGGEQQNQQKQVPHQVPSQPPPQPQKQQQQQQKQTQVQQQKPSEQPTSVHSPTPFPEQGVVAQSQQQKQGQEQRQQFQYEQQQQQQQQREPPQNVFREQQQQSATRQPQQPQQQLLHPVKVARQQTPPVGLQQKQLQHRQTPPPPPKPKVHQQLRLQQAQQQQQQQQQQKPQPTLQQQVAQQQQQQYPIQHREPLLAVVQKQQPQVPQAQQPQQQFYQPQQKQPQRQQVVTEQQSPFTKQQEQRYFGVEQPFNRQQSQPVYQQQQQAEVVQRQQQQYQQRQSQNQQQQPQLVSRPQPHQQQLLLQQRPPQQQQQPQRTFVVDKYQESRQQPQLQRSLPQQQQVVRQQQQQQQFVPPPPVVQPKQQQEPQQLPSVERQIPIRIEVPAQHGEPPSQRQQQYPQPQREPVLEVEEQESGYFYEELQLQPSAAAYLYQQQPSPQQPRQQFVAAYQPTQYQPAPFPQEYREQPQRREQLFQQQQPLHQSQKQFSPKPKYDFEYLYDPSPEPQWVHPYLRLPEQVEYFIQQQRTPAHHYQSQNQMPPPPVSAPKPAPATTIRQNGVPAPPQKGQQQPPQQQQPTAVKAPVPQKGQQQQQPQQQQPTAMKAAPPPAQKGQQPQQQPSGGPRVGAQAPQQKPVPAQALAGTKPPQFTQQPKSLAVEKGKPAVFEAKATGTPVPSLTWLNISAGGKPIAAQPGKVQIAESAGQSKFTIQAVSDADYGTYACVAANPGGQFQAQFTLQPPQQAQQQQQMKGQQNQQQFANQQQQQQGQQKSGAAVVAQKSAAGGAGAPRNRFQSPALSEQGIQREQVILKRVDQSKQYGEPKRLHLMEEQPPPSTVPPKFSGPLKSQTLSEGQHAMLDCKFQPTDDPNLKIAWLLNGKALVASSRITTLYDFGYAVLEINPVTVFDHGEYTIVAVNTAGEARQSATLEVVGHRSDSAADYIQRNLVAEDQVVPEPKQQAPGKERPNFHKELRSQELFVGQPLHLETKLTPLNDPSLKIQFYLNGNIVQPSDRVQLQFQNGFAVLYIEEATEQDAGYYVFRAENDVGDAETAATILVLPRMDTSVYLEGVNVVDVDDARELQSSQEQGKMHAPKIVQPPRDFHCDADLARSYFEARVIPVHDPSLRVQWLKDGQPLGNANRIQLTSNFGFCSLSIHPTYPEDAGVYTLVVTNQLGEARADANLSTISTEPLQLDPLHEQSLTQIQGIEAYRVHIGPVLSERPEEFQSLEAPRFARPLSGKVEVDENEPVHFECRIQPANDVKMRVEWFHNDAPLSAAHKFRPMFDFGYVALDLLYAYPEDSGIYKVVAYNELGSVESSVELAVRGKETLLTDAQHPEGLERIAELEQPKDFGLAEVPDRECESAPQFVGDMQDVELNEHDDFSFQLRLEPVHDPTMLIEWFHNDGLLFKGSRVHPQADFGFVTLSLRGVIPEDSGTYTVRATNALGQDQRSCQVNVLGKDAVQLAPHHEDALGKIEYLENLDKFPRQEIPDYEPTPPAFVEPLPADLGSIEEGFPVHMECKVEPRGDNQLRIYWLHDGQPLGYANRFRTFHDFGFCSLDILSVFPQDAGTYQCVAENNLGRAETQTQLECAGTEGLQLDTLHPTSVDRIAQLEAPRPPEEEVPEEEKQAPFFTKPLSGQLQVAESDNVYLEVQYGPVDDNTLTYEWLINGQPLIKAHRFVLSQDFGFAALNILYMYPEDSGTYSLVIRNAQGQEASSSVEIICEPKDSLLGDTFHPQSVQRIAELEAPRPPRAEAPEPEKKAPAITRPLAVSAPVATETQALHLDAQYTPTDDNQLVVEWYRDGQPLKQSNRYRLISDFGYASLDINFAIADDAGEYTLVVRNELGEAQTSASIQIEGGALVMVDPLHPESYRRVLELEAVKPAEPTEPELEAVAPQFTQQLSGPTEELAEGAPLHMECTVQPINDPKLRIEWLKDGLPLQFSSRIRTIHDFGYVALEFAHIHPDDSGTYTCRAVNEAGEVTTELTLNCTAKRNLYLESQHEQSWAKIQEMEGRQLVREPSPELVFGPPTFIVPLSNHEDLIEGDPVRLECRLQPVNDPTLKVQWTVNGNALPEGNRFMPARNLDLVTLDILTVYPEDDGVYTCRAVSDFGEAATSATVKCQATDALLLDTQHEQSWIQIQEIESRRPPEPIVPEPVLMAPRFVQPLPTGLAPFDEGAPIHLEGRVEPTDDNQLVVEWYKDGQPLANGHRFRHLHDFGYISLDILYAFPQDSGEYVCVARNSQGEAQSATTLQIGAGGSLFLDPLHQQSWVRIQELEAPKPVEPEPEPAPSAAPQFIGPLQQLQRIEGQPAHFETRVQPANDTRLQVVWLRDGQPIGNSNRHRFTNDFGFIALDISSVVAADGGQYSVVAINEAGQAQVDGQLEVEQIEGLLLDTQHPQSWDRIQAIEAPRPLPEAKPDVEHGPPKFTQQLNSVTDLVEGQPAHFEAMVEPVADPRLRIQWFHNGRPLAASNRVSYRNDFGLVTLDVHYVLPQDIGDYRCVATNDAGEAATEGHLDCQRRADLYLDPQHPQSWARIQELEAPRPPQEAPEPQAFAKPQFTQALQSLADVPEGSAAVFQGRVIPVGDPNLQILWFRDDQPLGQSNRFAMHQDFGFVALHIAGVTVHDAGVYSCKAVNLEGAAISSAQLSVAGDVRIHTDPLHAQSYARIQELEAIDKHPKLAFPDREYQKPQWTQTFQDADVETDGGIVQLIGLVEPAQDPDLRMEWFLNGVPLMNANRFRQDYAFGQAMLTIIHVLPHDTGVYSCRAWNAAGEATTSATVKVAGYEAILKDTQHPVSWERIQELEAPKIVEEVEVPVVKEKPRFLTQLESAEEVPEGTPVRLEATFQPARDNDLVVLWDFNGAPLGASQLVRTRVDLGWACLEISAVNLDHVGVYTLKISNSEGEAASSATVKVAGIGDILGDTKHEESWRQIQILEAPKPKEPTPPPPVYPAPTFQTQIMDIECDEGDAVKFEASFMPNNDPNIRCQWVRNGVPLAHGNKFAISYDFGYCTLGIGYAFPEDEGVYQLVVTNDAGEAVTSATLKCNAKAAILDDTQHPQSWDRIQELEAPKPVMPEAEPKPKEQPRFTSALLTPGQIFEGQPAHFETTVEPADDNELRVYWLLNGTPVADSNRFKQIADFGWVILNVSDAEVRDTGEWTCVAVNSVGEARVSAQLEVAGKERLLLDPINQASYGRIQELEAPRPGPEEPAPKVYDAPQIAVQLQGPGELNEGDSAHLEAHYTPTNDPSLRVEWYRDGQPVAHSNRHKMVSDFGFAILDILYTLAHDTGEYTVRVVNEAGEAQSSAALSVVKGDRLLLQPQRDEKAKAVGELEARLGYRPEREELAPDQRVPVFVQPLAGPSESAQGDRAHFTARYEPLDDNSLRFFWTLNNRPLITGSRVKTITYFGYVVLEISPVYPEDSGEYLCRAVNAAGEAVTSVTLNVSGAEGIEHQSQLPQQRQQQTQQRIHELETRRPELPETPEIVHGPPRFVESLPAQVPQLREGVVLHLDAKLEPVGDPTLKVEWLHDGQPVRDTNRMKLIHDFGFVVLELCPAEPQDTGTWVCRASNADGQAETQCQIEVVGDSGVSYEWVSPGEKRERVAELDQWVNRPQAALAIPEADFGPPKFTEQLIDAGQLDETSAHAFICVLEPVGDPTLRIEWQHNGHSIPYSNRIVLSNDFGVITLLIKHLITQDSGEYRCIARNAKGEAQTAATITVQSVIQVETPQISHPLVESIDASEGEPIHLECRVTPINDPQLKILWFRNGQPLGDANRFVHGFEFGFVTLDILYSLPEDTGDYELRAVNDKGEASTRTKIAVVAKPGLIFSPQVPGVNVVDNLEHHLRQFTRAQLALDASDTWQPNAQQAPVFKSPLNNVGVEEGDFCRFETQLAPINDPYMRVEWMKDGKPVLIGARFRNTLDFGYACLDVLYALPDDTGEYTCVATNQFGQAKLAAKLACSGKKHVVTESQMPQGQGVRQLRKNIHWTDKGPLPSRQKQKPRFTIEPRNIQVDENQPARFECAVEGNPRPKVIWYVNGVQALQGHRFNLHYDGVHYLTIPRTRIADAGTVEVFAKNTEGECKATASLDIFQHSDFRQHQLRGAQLGMTHDEIAARQAQWQRETMGQLGEAFETAPKGDAQKLLKVEIARPPIEPLESEELVQKFTRPKNEQFYDKLAYVERPQREFPGMELEPVSLKAGKIEPYKPPKQPMEAPKLKAPPEKGGAKEPSPPPQWAAPGGVKLGEPVGKFTQLPEPTPEPQIPARDQVRFRGAKPKPMAEAPAQDRVTIEESKAKMVEPQQGPEIVQEPFVPHAKQVQMKQKFQPKVVKRNEAIPIEPEQPLKDIPPVVKEEIPGVTVPGKPQPTKLAPTSKKAPSVTTTLKPAQAEIGRTAVFTVAYAGDEPVTVKWFHDGREFRSTFDRIIRTTPGESRLDLSKLKAAHAGEYTVVLENVAGRVESKANLQVSPAAEKGVAPEFSQRCADARAQQNGDVQFQCQIKGEPRPTIQWFKDGKPLPNDSRFQMVESESGEISLTITGVLPPDAGIYECVAKNGAGETRCRARLSVVLAKTGAGAEAGPKLIAPRFAVPIKPVLGQEGAAAEFRAKYTGDPEPTIRWTRNNEPMKQNGRFETGYGNGEAWLKFSQLSQEDVAEYKCEAVNPAGKASTVANLVLKPSAGRVIGGKPGTFVQQAATEPGKFGAQPKAGESPASKVQAQAGKAPQFLQKLTSINARQGENVKFSAEFDGTPPPSIQWTFNGRVLAGGRDHKISVDGNKAVLELPKVTPASSGSYVCLIRNASGAAQSEAKLTVQSSPPPVPPRPGWTPSSSSPPLQTLTVPKWPPQTQTPNQLQTGPRWTPLHSPPVPSSPRWTISRISSYSINKSIRVYRNGKILVGMQGATEHV